ncbi:MAG: 4Fe-4S binding protein [Acidimicrobiales bacterium]
MAEPSGSAPDAEFRFPAARRAVDHASSWVERPVRRVAGSARFNPLPYAGTISVFLLGLVIVTGLYITLFFEFGHEASYRSVAGMEGHAIQKVMRALHRYASAALVVTTMVHAWRIFVAGRFSGRVRRWRWATGVTALLLVWLAGVTGYWLVWDRRAAALNEVVIGLTASTRVGVRVAVDDLGVVGGRSGSGFLLILWLVHLALTVVIGWFIFRHLRRSRQPWLPPPLWMAVMGVPLLMVSMAVPVGMLGPADPAELVGRIPVDPFVLFLLPPLLSPWAWVTVAVTVVAGVGLILLPRMLQRHDPPVVTIIDDNCTGCELCVADCPYDALAMVTTGPAVDGAVEAGAGVGVGVGAVTGRSVHDLLAAVDTDRCVGCGICLGSCAFGAIDLPGAEAPEALDVAGRNLLVVCDRHLATVAADQDAGAGETEGGTPVVYPVRCAGALVPTALRSFAERGALDVQLIGCAPHDCRYGIGNTLAAERLAGARRPHPPARYGRRVAQDWVDTDQVDSAMAHPGDRATIDSARIPARREALLGVSIIAMLTAAGVAFGTRAPFGQPSDTTPVRFVADHQPGEVLAQGPELGPVGPIHQVELIADGRSLVTIDGTAGDGRWTHILDVDDPGWATDEPTELEVRIGTDDGPITAYTVSVDPTPGRRTIVDLTDRPPLPGVDEGRDIFMGRTGGCSVCHSVRPGDDGVGPSLAGVGTQASTRVPGLDAEGYLRQSILLPDQYVVPGWPAGQMLPIYRERLSGEQLDAVVAYLMTLTEPGASPDPRSTIDPAADDGSDP